jgi:aerobic C4-dicarboxylate transport protein
LLQVLLLAVLTGFAINALPEAARLAASHTVNILSEIFFGVVKIVVRAAPLGAFGAMAFTIGAYGIGSLLRLGELVVTFYLTSALFVLIVLGSIARFCGFSILRFIAYIREELLIVLGTSSSESVLPQMMRKLQRLGCSPNVVGLTVPLGYSFNLDGTGLCDQYAADLGAGDDHPAGRHADLEGRFGRDRGGLRHTGGNAVGDPGHSHHRAGRAGWDR